MPSVEWNLQERGHRHGRGGDGDQRSALAEYCRQPYDHWDQSLIETFIDRPMPFGAAGAEIAPGYGRWPDYILPRAGGSDIVDINQNCLDAGLRRFDGNDRLVPLFCLGSTMPFTADESENVLWSFK